MMGGRLNVIIIDTVFDDGYLGLSDELRSMGYRVKLDAINARDIGSLSNRVTALCKEEELIAIRGGSEKPEFYLEVGGLDHIGSGAMYSSAYNVGSRIVYIDDEGRLIENTFEKAPDVKLIRYAPRKILDTLHEEGDMDRGKLSRKVYADRIVNMSEDEIKDFFSKNHNTYKAIDNVLDKGWVKYNRLDKTFTLTERGNLARVLLNLRDEEKNKDLGE